MIARSGNYHLVKLFLLVPCILLLGCQSGENQEEIGSSDQTTAAYVPRSPLWERSTDLFLVDIATYTPQGTFRDFVKYLPDLKKMGVQTLVLKQICPVGFDRNSEPSANPSAVSDFTKVNPEYGTFEDFTKLTQEIRDLRMHLLIEWEPNHTSWDHSWLISNPEWYVHIADTITHAMDAQGNHTDMRDVAELDYSQSSLRSMMIEALRFWIRSSNIDGFLISHADLVPEDFWMELRPALDEIKPVLLVTKTPISSATMGSCFQGFLDEEWSQLLASINQSSTPAEQIRQHVEEQSRRSSRTSYPVNFFDLDAADQKGLSANSISAMYTVNATLPGINMFNLPAEQHHPLRQGELETNFFLRLLQLKQYNEALWNGIHGGSLKWLTDHEQVLAFRRDQSGQSIVTVVNCSGEPQEATLDMDSRNLSELFTGGDQLLHRELVIELQPWEYRVYANPSIAL